MRNVTLSRDITSRLQRLAAVDGDRPALTPEHGRALARVSAEADWRTEGPAEQVAEWLSARAPVSAAVRRALIATLALRFVDNAPDIVLPESVRDLYGPAFSRLARFLAEVGVYDDDAFAKDLRLVLGCSVPAGAQDVDLAWRRDLVGAAGRVKRAAAAAVRLAAAGDISTLTVFARAEPWRPWLQIHTDERNLADFTPSGWDQCYRRIGDLLGRRPEYAGMVGVSWFYDPAVAEISPRLAYLQARPLANGAVRVRLGANAADVERATRTSEHRRALHAAGLYAPRSWAIYWPRDSLLAWAETADRPLQQQSAAA